MFSHLLHKNQHLPQWSLCYHRTLHLKIKTDFFHNSFNFVSFDFSAPNIFSQFREHIHMLCPSVFAKISSTNCLFLTFDAFIWKEPKLSNRLCLRLTTCYKLVIFQYSAWLSIIWVFICKFKSEYFSHSPKLSTQLRLRLTTCFKLVIFNIRYGCPLNEFSSVKSKNGFFSHVSQVQLCETPTLWLTFFHSWLPWMSFTCFHL